MNLWLQNCETESKGPRKVTKDVIRGLVVEKKIISPNTKENSILCITGDIRNMYIVNLKSNLIVPNKDKCAEYNPAITFQGCILHECTELKNICMRILLLAFFI